MVSINTFNYIIQELNKKLSNYSELYFTKINTNYYSVKYHDISIIEIQYLESLNAVTVESVAPLDYNYSISTSMIYSASNAEEILKDIAISLNTIQERLKYLGRHKLSSDHDALVSLTKKGFVIKVLDTEDGLFLNPDSMKQLSQMQKTLNAVIRFSNDT